MTAARGPAGAPSAAAGGPLQAAARSGLMGLSGAADGPPVAPPLQLVRRLDRLVDALADASAAVGRPVRPHWPTVLTGRAALLGLSRRGATSANGTCRVLPAADGWVAVNLARADDRRSVPALVGLCRAGGPDRSGDPGVPGDGGPGAQGGDDGDDAGRWAAVAALAAVTPAARLVASARLLGVPAAVLGAVPPAAAPPAGDPAGCVTTRPWPAVPPRPLAGLRVVDCSTMWAGPLAAAVLAGAGARVVKVDSRTRPDGTRGHPAVYRWLHPPGQEELVLDLTTVEGRARLRHLLAGADVVVESARPRALAQLGAAPHQLPTRPGRVWLSITGYGRRGPGAGWVAFGDDAAVAGGLVGWAGPGQPVFVGDAIADPLAGLCGALAALRALAEGGGALVAVSMAATAAAMAAGPLPPAPEVRPSAGGGWVVVVGGEPVPVLDPPLPVGFVADPSPVASAVDPSPVAPAVDSLPVASVAGPSPGVP